jgi:hypothetical protein
LFVPRWNAEKVSEKSKKKNRRKEEKSFHILEEGSATMCDQGLAMHILWTGERASDLKQQDSERGSKET